ncbi:MAG: hypothetical protein IT294_19315 [Deltaproteobacteria bacterium]|nr:hypothetical protein [Deltaproteobacteria bacterium]
MKMMKISKRAYVLAAVAVTMVVRTTGAAAPTWTTTFFCTPMNVAMFAAQRMHVRCTTGGSPGGNIVYFAFSAKKKDAAPMLDLLLSAKAQGKHLMIYYNPDDLSGQKIGCATNDCRLIVGAELRD